MFVSRSADKASSRAAIRFSLSEPTKCQRGDFHISTPHVRKLSVAVIDDHDVIHAGLQTWCAQASPPIEVAGTYTSLDAMLADHPGGQGPFDVVVLDLELQSRRPDFSALEKLVASGHRVVVYSHITHDEVILQCLELGAVTYVSKPEGKAHLLEAIRSAATDTAYIGPRMAAAIANDVRGNRPNLAQREKEVLIAWFQTESKDLVARKLFIAPSTVRTHLQRVRAKYAAAGRPAATKAALVARAVQDGIISVDEL